MLTLFTYDNQRPDRVMIEQSIIKGREYTYLTATRALAAERVRNGLIPEKQRFTDERGTSRTMAVFADVIRAWTKQKYPLSSRGEEKTMLFRAMKKVSDGNPQLRDLLRQDFASWMRILYSLASEGIDLRTAQLPESKRKSLVNPVIESYLKDIQASFYDQLDNAGKRLFEAAARDYVVTLESTPQVVVMEGFTFLTELQRWFYQQCDRQNIEVVFLVPYREQQKQSFAIIDMTYDFIQDRRFGLETPSLSDKSDIAFVQRHLLEDGKRPVLAHPIENVILRQYQNRDRELQGCISQLNTWFSSGLYEPKDVVVVMRRSKEFIDRIRDYMEMYPLKYIDPQSGQPREVELASTPRLLLLTPVGRFILNLYQVWEAGKMHLEANALESILSSGWLGAAIQDSTPSFRAIKYQYFMGCRSGSDWLDVLRQLRRDCEEESVFRLPIGVVDLETIRKWEEVVGLLERVCLRLFSGEDLSVARHIKTLQEELNKMLPADLRKAERSVLEQIQAVFEEMSGYYSIPLSTEEFGDAIHALTRGNSDDDEEGDSGGESLSAAELRIVTPETLDGMSYKVVLYVGCDNVHAPVLYPEPWPFYTDGREMHLATERYMFLTVVRAASEQLVLTYAQKDADRSFQPSTYMQEVEILLGKKREVQGILDTLDLSLAHDGVKEVKVRVSKRKAYDLNDIAHYALCPLRYRLELLHPEARMYRSEWQLEIYAQSIWLNRIFGFLADSDVSPPIQTLPAFTEHLLGIMEVSKNEIHKMFPAFSPITWHSIELQVKGQLNYIGSERKYKYFKSVYKGSKESFRVLIEDEHEEQTVKINIEVPYMVESAKYDYPLFSDFQTSEWLLPGQLAKDEPNRERETTVEIDGVRLFRTQYDAVMWWRNSISAYYSVEKKQKVADNAHTLKLDSHYAQLPEKISYLVKSIEGNKFPKHAGEHCTSCPVRLECLGIIEQQDEVLA